MSSSVIIGAGLGGVTAAETLRASGFAGRIVLINREPGLPYDRPPLSKGVLQGTDALGDIRLKPESWYEDHQVELQSNATAVRIDPDAHFLELEDGSLVAYDKLLLATGADARRLPMLEQDRVPFHYLRDYRDASALKAALQPSKRLVLVGAGVIGLEVAASARQIGCEVSVVEIASRVMARSVPKETSTWLQNQHERRGVKFHLECSVAEFQSDAPHLELSNGVRIEADAMLICAGVNPCSGLAEACGIACDNGVLVDEYCQTSAKDVYAIGDVACYPDGWERGRVRSENWMHAQRHAECAARNICGMRTPYVDIQTVWTDQYDFKLQVAGVLNGERRVVRGDASSHAFMIFHVSDRVVTGVLGVNQPKFMRIAQTMIKSRAEVDVKALADTGVGLKRAMQ